MHSFSSNLFLNDLFAVLFHNKVEIKFIMFSYESVIKSLWWVGLIRREDYRSVRCPQWSRGRSKQGGAKQRGLDNGRRPRSVAKGQRVGCHVVQGRGGQR